MNLRISRERLWFLLRIAAPIAAAVILFFSGIFPVEELLTLAPQNLIASVAPSDVASLTNEQRLENGLAPLSVSPLLTEAAQLKAEDMAAQSYYAHTGPDGKTMLDWMHEVGYNYLNAGENLVIDRTTATQAVDAWMNSLDHRANILRPQFTQLGIGVAEGEYDGIHTIFVVQEFGTPYPTSATLAITRPSKAVPAPLITTPASTTVAIANPKPHVLSVPSAPKPSVLPKIASFAPTKVLATSGSSTTAVSTTSSTATTTAKQGTSTIAYALAPEFFAPVTLTPKQSAQDAAQSAAPQASSVSRISVWVQEIKLYIRAIFK